MMAIEEALVSDTTLLMLDEPSEGLSVFVIQRIPIILGKSVSLTIRLVSDN
ncbi:hypothetical protein D1BOALGB6SA_7775 [Olavius sp. associated proteobacterium Delta 1]|nr:hypothetical protein D1BOALGB6SA_7775 [Olavius sp. associated proteobacterium Delta 1]